MKLADIPQIPKDYFNIHIDYLMAQKPMSQNVRRTLKVTEWTVKLES